MVLVNKVNAYTEYKIGDMVTYNEIDYYVIKNSSSKEDSVTMLKAEPLTVEEVNTYGVGHVNRYKTLSPNTAYDNNGYGGMQYYSSEDCGYVNNRWVYTGCTTDYDESEVKHVVDMWAENEINTNDLVIDSTGYKVRLINVTDLENLGYIFNSGFYVKNDDANTWIYSNKYKYWTMTHYNQDEFIWVVDINGCFAHNMNEYGGYKVVRPVITLSKLALGDIEEEEILDDVEGDRDSNIDIDNENKDATIKVNVPNTYMQASIVIIVLGIISAGVGVFIYYKISNKKE